MNKKNGWMVSTLGGFAILLIALGAIGLHMHAKQNSVDNESRSKESSLYNLDKMQAAAQKHGASDTNGKKAQSSVSFTGEGVTMIGDSVTVGIESYLKEQLPNMTVDGKVGRQMSQAVKVINELAAQGKLGEQVIIELGTNGPFSKDQLRDVLQSLSEARQVLLVTTRVPKGWQDAVNDTIAQVAGEYSNVSVVDWYSASVGKDEYFYRDGVHLKPDGSRYYTSLLVAALQKS
ncbi:O-acetyltransferase OatA [compost metagenome]